MNKKALRIAGWALGLSLAVAGIGVAVGTSRLVTNNAPVMTKAAEDDTHDFAQSLSQLLNNGASVSPISIPDQGYPIKKIIVTWSHNKNSNGVNMTATVGGESVTPSPINLKNNTTTTEITVGGLKGAVVISFANQCTGTKQGTFSVSNVRLVEDAVPAAENPITGISSVSLSVSSAPINSVNSITATATFAPAESDELVKWSSSDESVATILGTSTNGTANITLKGVGTCYFTASNQAGTITCNSGSFEVTTKQMLSTVEIVKASLKVNDSSQSSTYAKYEGAQEVAGLGLDVTSVMPATKDTKDVVQIKKNEGVIKNTEAFTFGAKMIRFNGEGTPAVNFAVGDTASSASNSSNSVKLGDSYFFVPKGLASDAEFFYIKQTNTDTGYYTSITILAEAPAAKAFAEMYLDAYSCDPTGGSSTALNEGYTLQKLQTLFQALDSGVQTILTNAVKNHSEAIAEDVMKEFGQRYWLINHNHGTTHDFMGLSGTVSFASPNIAFSNNNSESMIPLIVTIATLGTGAAVGFFLFQRKRKEI